jgi:translation elongation factor EF-1alpha
MLDMFAEGTKGRDNFTLHLTNHEGKDKEFELKPILDAFITTERAKGRTFKVEFREPSSSSMVLNLLDAITH